MWAGEFHNVVLPYEMEQRAEQSWLLAEAERAFARARGTMGDYHASVRDLGLVLPILWLDGRWAEARRRVAASPASAPPWLTLARIAHAQGDADAAWPMIRELLLAGPASEPGQTMFLPRLPFLRLGADLALDAGDLAAARAWLGCHDRWLAWSGAVLGQAEGRALWAAYHWAAGDLAQAHEHAAKALAHAAEPRQPLALLAAHRLLGELDTASGRHSEAAAHLEQALLLANACEVPYERALTLLATAELRHVTGERDEAQATLGEARATLTDLEARPALTRVEVLAARLAPTSPAQPVAPAYPAGLSAREVEVLRLVAEGLPDAQIAARLYLSPYTVKAHLRSIYGKLGVASRTAASRFAIERGLS